MEEGCEKNYDESNFLCAFLREKGTREKGMKKKATEKST